MRLSPDFINQNYPIVSVRFYQNGMEIIRTGDLVTQRSRGRRDYVTELSAASLCKLAFTAQNSRVKFESMLCLTCGVIYPHDGLLFKSAMNRVFAAMRYKYEPFEYLWFLEFQARGAPHVHVMTNVAAPGKADRNWIGEKWSDALLSRAVLVKNYETEELEVATNKMRRQHSRARVWETIRGLNGARRYVTKYATKPQQKIVPRDFARVGRFWGVSRNARPKPLATSGATEEMMRIHLAGRNHPVAEWNVLPRLIWFRDDPEGG